MNRFFNITLSLLFLFTSSCAGSGKPQPNNESTVAYWAGDGGKNISLGILVPESQGLNEDQTYLPAMVQGVLVANISKYSAISVLDRVSLDKVIAETLDPTYEDNLDIVRLGHIAHVGNIMTGKILRTSTGYTLQINVTDTTPDARTIASYSSACTIAELDDHTAIQKASQDLLTQMGVQLTADAKNGLSRTNSQSIDAQTALARGITAQRQGTEVVALSYYFQATDFDPSLLEAENRSSILAANISSGNIGTDIRNDIVWRRQWVERLQEAETFFANYIKDLPFYLVYNTNISQGEINYQNETAALSFWTGFLQDDRWTNTINAVMRTVETGLLATGRDKAWGLDWPNKSIGTPSPFTDKTNTISVVAEIINDQGSSIGRQTIIIPTGYAVRYGMIYPKQWEGSVTFPGVNANLITDRLTIQISTIDGIPAENAAQQKRISIIPEAEFIRSINPRWASRPADNEAFFTVDKDGKLTRYSGPGGDVVIPVTVTEIGNNTIGDYAFYKILKYNQLTSVIIPTSVRTIGKEAFRGNLLTSVTIPTSVRTIGESAFYDNQLTSVIIPTSVRSIGKQAFYYNQLTSVTIPDSVTTIEIEAFGNNKLTSVTIPSSITRIRYLTFDTNKLTSITIPDGVTNIEWSAFNGNQLTSITIPNSVTSIEKNAFRGNPLTSITIGANVSIEPDTYSSYDRKEYKEFISFYNNNGKKAGVYTYRRNNWNYSPQ